MPTNVAKWIVDACDAYKRGDVSGMSVKFKYLDGRIFDAQVLYTDGEGDRPVMIRYRIDNRWSTYCLQGDGSNTVGTLLPPDSPLLECYVNQYQDGHIGLAYGSASVAIQNSMGAARVAVHMREVRDAT